MFLGARGENDFKLVQKNLEKNLRKEIQKRNRKGAGAAGPTPPPFRPSKRPGLPPPPPLSRARTPASSQPASATWRPYAGDGRAAADRLHLVGTPARAPRPSHSLCRPRPSPSSLHSRAQPSRRTPPQRHRRSSSAAHRRPLQRPNLDTEATSAFAIVRVSLCERSTEVRVRRAP